VTAATATTATTPTSAPAWRTSLSSVLPDVLVLTALSMLGLLGFQPAFGQYAFLVAGIGGLVIGSVVALVGYLFEFSLLVTVIGAIAAYFVFGSALTMPSRSIAGFLPTLDSIAALVSGAVFGWSDAVTLHTPLEAPPYIAVLPYVATWLVSLVAVSLVCRWLPRRRRTPLRAAVVVIPSLALFVTAILIGTRDPFYAGIRSIAFAAVALLWIGWRRRNADTVASASIAAPGVLRRRVTGIAIVVIGAIAVGALGGSLAMPAQSSRFVLRQAVTPPFDPLNYPSPLAGFRKYTDTLEKTKLFTVSGLAAGSYIRMATMDSYNGVVWNVAPAGQATSDTGTFELLGRTIPNPPLFTPGAKQKATLTIDGYSDVWLPDVGYVTSLDFNRFSGVDPTTTVRVNTVTGTAALTSGVSKGLSYTLGVTGQKLPTDKQLANIPPASLPSPPISNVPDVVTAKAKEYAGTASTAIQKLRNIERSLKTFGYLSHGRASDPVPSRAGEGADRMIQLFGTSPMVGDQEQYASAFALMAHTLGYPVRVVMGFKPPTGAGTVTVTGNNVTAWDEVAFKGVGWIPFFPTPTKTDAPKQQTTQPKLEPQPQVRQPPRTNPKNDQLLTPVKTKNDTEKHKPAGFALPVWAWVVGGIILIPLMLYFIPLGIILILKRRRRARRNAGDADRRASGAWDELIDGFVELGFTLPRVASRLQTAGALERQSAAQGVEVQAGTLAELARRVDHAVFAAGAEADTAVDALWHDVDAVRAGLSAGVGWLRGRIATLRYVRR
jgi:Transglutaminase-like superfamily